MASIHHIYPTRQPPPPCPVVPAEFVATPLRLASWAYWNAATQAGRGNPMAPTTLRAIVAACPSGRLAGAAAGTLERLECGRRGRIL